MNLKTTTGALKTLLLTFASIISTDVKELSENLHNKAVRLIKKLKLPSKAKFFTTQEDLGELIGEIKKDPPEVIIANVATGGVENLILEVFERTKVPMILIANDKSNSLAAALEIRAYLRERGIDIPLLFHVDFEKNFLKSLIRTLKAEKIHKGLTRKRIGIIGEPSPWLLTMYLSKSELRRFNVVFVELDRLYEEYKRISDAKALRKAEEIINKAREIHLSKEDIIKAIKVYLALKLIVKENKLEALTIRCFDLIDVLGTTGCLAMSMLNDEGIVAACEGDFGALITMMILSEISNQPVWMGNLASINKAENSIILAHCTIASRLLRKDGLKLSPHYESKRGVAVSGAMSNKEVTIARVGGTRLDKCLMSLGRIIMSDLGRNDMCRCQVEIKLKGKVDRLIKESLGNHLVLATGDHLEELLEVCRRLKLKPIVVN